MNAERLEGRRIKFNEIQGPEDIDVTDDMLNRALSVLRHEQDIEAVSLNDKNEFVVTAERPRTAWKAVQRIEQLMEKVWRLIIDTMIKEARKAKRKLRQAPAARKNRRTPYLNDKSKTGPATVPAT